MRYYFSDSSFNKEIEKFVCKYAKNRLISYYYKNSIRKYIDIYKNFHGDILDISEYSLIIDSGAYSVWNSKKPSINIQDYAVFCNELLSSIRKLPFFKVEFINLDVIPGKKGQKTTHYQKEFAQQKGHQNYLWLKERVPNILPVFHQGDDMGYISKIEEHTLRYCISPANDKTTQQRIPWIVDVFHKANKEIKPHGLGFSNATIANACSWDSFDAATHALRAGFGVVMYCNEERLIDLVFSTVRSSQDTGTHFMNLSEIERDLILDEFSQINKQFTFYNIMNKGGYRKMLNMYYINKYYTAIKPVNSINLTAQETLF